MLSAWWGSVGGRYVRGNRLAVTQTIATWIVRIIVATQIALVRYEARFAGRRCIARWWPHFGTVNDTTIEKLIALTSILESGRGCSPLFTVAKVSVNGRGSWWPIVHLGTGRI